MVSPGSSPNEEVATQESQRASLGTCVGCSSGQVLTCSASPHKGMTPHEEMVLSEGWPPQVPPKDWAHNKVQKGDVLMYQELQLCQLLPVCGICTPLRGSEAQGNSPVSGKGLQDPTKVPETPLSAINSLEFTLALYIIAQLFTAF